MTQLPPALVLHHLDRPGVRERMVGLWEAERDEFTTRLPRHVWPYGRDLSGLGWQHFLGVMPQALAAHDMAWLASSINAAALWRPWRYQTRRGRSYRVRLNVPDAAVKLAHGEFNIAYVRAVATLAQEAGIATCEVYRAAPAAVPRPTCECNEGPGVSCNAILEGLRAYFTGAGAEISIPAGPHCHHSIRFAPWMAEAA